VTLAKAGTPKIGQRATIKVVTSGTSSYNITAGTSVMLNGALATGTVSGKTLMLSLVVDDAGNLTETARTGAM
jgi:hypothetical protein